MIRVTVDLISAQDPARDRTIGIAHIANTGRGAAGRYTYEVMLSKTLPGDPRIWKRGRAALVDDQLIADQLTGELVAFDNVKRGAWDLIYCVLRAVVGARNPVAETPDQTGEEGRSKKP